MFGAVPGPARDAEVDDELGGRDLSRIVALSDGIFAFAMTLLALSLTVPVVLGPGGAAIPSANVTSGELGNALGAELPAFFTYLLAFFLLGFWWEVHHRLFAHLRRWDRRLLWLNLAFLLAIAVTPFLVSLYTRYGSLQPALMVYAGAQGSAGLLLAVLWDHATRDRALVAPDLDPELIARYRTRLLVTVGIFAVSVLVALVSVSAGQLLWVTVFVYSTASTLAHRRRRRARGVPAAATAP